MAGLGFVMSFGYWCTDFLVIQRAMAANSMSASRRTPVIAALPKMMMPFIVIVPGIAALALSQMAVGYALPLKNGGPDYDQVLTTLMAHFYPAGMLGVGLTGLMASFMVRMAGNVTAFNTVFTYDLYQTYIKPGQADHHYLTVGRITTVVGVLLSIGTAYLAQQFNSINDMLQLVFSFVNAPLLRHLPAGNVGSAPWATAPSSACSAARGGGAHSRSYGRRRQGGWLGNVREFLDGAELLIAIVAWTTCFRSRSWSAWSRLRARKAKSARLVYGLTELEARRGGKLVSASGAACDCDWMPGFGSEFLVRLTCWTYECLRASSSPWSA